MTSTDYISEFAYEKCIWPALEFPQLDHWQREGKRAPLAVFTLEVDLPAQ